MDDPIDLVPSKDLFEIGAVGHVSPDEACLREGGRRRAPQVEDQHLVAALQELLGDVQADEARAAGEKDHFL
jgi:hypothetical protein